MKKQILALLLSLALCFSLVGTAFAVDEWTVGPGGEVYVEPPDNPPEQPSTPVTPNYNYNYTPSNPTYTVTNGSGTSDNGTWSSNRTSASRGDTVTITAKPNDGYQVDSVTVKDANGNGVAVKDLGDNKYSFTMPGSKVDVSVTFKPVVRDNPFVDVARSDYFYDAVLWAVEKGITNGTGPNTFSPADTCTRAQTVTFLWRAAGSPAPASTTHPFTDVDPSAYYYNAMLWAVEQGITNGTSATTFSPNATVTRGQTVTFLFRAAKAQAASGSNPFTDVAAGDYYTDAVQWAVAQNITNGTSATTFSPNTGCTRGQIVTFLYRAS